MHQMKSHTYCSAVLVMNSDCHHHHHAILMAGHVLIAFVFLLEIISVVSTIRSKGSQYSSSLQILP